MQCVQGKKATKKSWQNKTLRIETSCWMIKNGRLLKIASYNDLKCVEIPVKSRSLTNSENLFVWNAVFCAQSRFVWIFYSFASAMKMKPNENSVSIAELGSFPSLAHISITSNLWSVGKLSIRCRIRIQAKMLNQIKHWTTHCWYLIEYLSEVVNW